VVVPVGGGGLIGGIACAVERNAACDSRDRRPDCCAAFTQSGFDRAHAGVAARGATIADGIAVRQTGAETFALAEKYVDEIVTVDDEEIAMAILRLLERQKTLAEGAGAAAVAAMLQHKTSLDGAKTAVVVSAGNIDVTLLAHIIERGLVKDGRLVRFRVTLSDHPGGLERLTGVVARDRANIVQVVHDRAYFCVHLSETTVDITMETRGQDHVEELMRELHEAGYRFERVL